MDLVEPRSAMPRCEVMTSGSVGGPVAAGAGVRAAVACGGPVGGPGGCRCRLWALPVGSGLGWGVGPVLWWWVVKGVQAPPVVGPAF